MMIPGTHERVFDVIRAHMENALAEAESTLGLDAWTWRFYMLCWYASGLSGLARQGDPIAINFVERLAREHNG